MRAATWWLALVSSVACAAGAKLNATGTGTGHLRPIGYIIELQKGASIHAVEAAGLHKRDNPSDHDVFHAQLSKRRIGYKIRYEFASHPDLFYGVSLSLVKPSDAAQLHNIAGVKTVWPIDQVFLPSSGVNVKNATLAAALKGRKNTGNIIRRSITSLLPGRLVLLLGKIGLVKQSKLNQYGPLYMTGLSKAQSWGFRGKGVNIAIVDTGIDYNHPDLGGGFGPGFKVSKGYDFVGDNYAATGVATPDGNPYSSGCVAGAHGTHVAGIAAGLTNNVMGIGGAAPDANIFAYKIYDCGASSSSDLVMQAVLRAVDDGADIINLSLATNAGWTSTALAVFIARVVDQRQIFVVSASGDNGLVGLFFPAAPAIATGTLSVGMVNSITTNMFTITTSTGYGPIHYYGSHSFGFTNLPVYATSATISPDADACDPLPSSTPNLANRIVVVSRGGCFVYQKLQNIAAFGATRALVYDYQGNTDPLYDDGLEVGFPNGNNGFISYDDGAYLVNQFNARSSLTLTGNNPAIYQTPNPGAGMINELSQIGPTFDLYPGVSLVAPGNNILSTYPLDLGAYSVLSGTSQAAPYVSGALAVYLSANKLSKPYDVAGISNIFTWSANPTNDSYSGINGLDPVPTQGGGLLNAFTPLSTYATRLSPTFLNLNDTRFFAKTQTITVKNTALLPKTYVITHSPAATVYSLEPQSIYPATWPYDSAAPGSASVTINGASKATVFVLPLQTVSINLRFSPPTGVDTTRFPVYSGFIELCDGTDDFNVPYMGVGSRMYDLPVLDTSNQVAGVTLPLICDSNFNIQSGPATYTYQGASVPNLALRLVGGTPHLRVDVLAGNQGNATSPSGSKPYLAFDSVPRLGLVPGLDAVYVGRDTPDSSLCVTSDCTVTQVVAWDGTVQQANGTIVTLPNGAYKLRLAGVKVTGDPTNYYDYEIYTSPVINIRR